MKIAVNTRLLIDGKLDGIGWYTFEVLQRMVKNHPEVEFIFFFDRTYLPDFVFEKNVTPVVLSPQARHPILFRIWFNRSVKKALKKHQPDLFWSPDGYLSLTTDTPQVATIHDLNFEHRPQDLKKTSRKFYRKYFPLFAQKSKHIITVSNYSKNDLVKRYKMAASKVSVIYNGVSTAYHPPDKKSQESTRNEWTNGAEYFFFIGSLHPRKNINRMLLAFDQYKKDTGSTDRLILAGNPYDWTTTMEQTYQNMVYKEDVLLTGRIPQKRAVELMGAAKALLYVSLFEGFGMPILEAFQAHTPVIAGNNTSIPEVAGDAAFLIDAKEVGELVAAMNAMQETETREKLIAAGIEQLNHFSWDKTAEQTFEILAHAATIS